MSGRAHVLLGSLRVAANARRRTAWRAAAAVAALGVTCSVPECARALDASAILERTRALADAGGNRSAEFTLEVHGPGWQAERAGRIYKQVTDDARSTLIVLDAPEQVRGIKVLSRSPVGGRPQQWLYAPGTRRTRRVAAGVGGRSLFGGDFSASDLEHRRPGLDAALTGRETRDGYESYVIEVDGEEDGRPVHEALWVRTSDFRLVRREFYADGRLARVYRVDALEDVSGIATPVEMTLLNIATGTWSRIHVRAVRYGAPLDAALFALPHLDGPFASAPEGVAP